MGGKIAEQAGVRVYHEADDERRANNGGDHAPDPVCAAGEQGGEGEVGGGEGAEVGGGEWEEMGGGRRRWETIPECEAGAGRGCKEREGV